jgi:hypothetical protein
MPETETREDVRLLPYGRDAESWSHADLVRAYRTALAQLDQERAFRAQALHLLGDLLERLKVSATFATNYLSDRP